MRMQFKSIICATDFSDFSNRTISYGVALAKEFESKLYVCHVIDLSSVAIYGEFQLDPVGLQNRIMKDATEQLEELIGGMIEDEPAPDEDAEKSHEAGPVQPPTSERERKLRLITLNQRILEGKR